MKLAELEKMLGIMLPIRFHEIYETGAMKWLEMRQEQIQQNRDKYIHDEKALLMLNCGCELFLFEEIPHAIETLKEWIQWQEEDEEVTLAKEITLIPFGHNAGGDLYCFLYSPESEEPKVILYLHDEYGNPEIIGHTFDEFLYVQMLEAVDDDEDIEGRHFQENINYLNDSYRQLIIGKTSDSLKDDYAELTIDEAEIWN